MKPYGETVERLTATLAEVHERNKRRIQDKGIYINWSLICSIIGVGILLLSVVISCQKGGENMIGDDDKKKPEEPEKPDEDLIETFRKGEKDDIEKKGSGNIIKHKGKGK